MFTSYYRDVSVIIISVNDVYKASKELQVAVKVGIEVKNPRRYPLTVDATRIWPFNEKDLDL